MVLVTFLVGTGIGSLLSEFVPISKRAVQLSYPLMIGISVLLLPTLLRGLLANLVGATLPARIALSIALLAPYGMVLGLFFPLGMRLVPARRDDYKPWYWALNGMFSVMASAASIQISMQVGISYNFFLAAALYLLVAGCNVVLGRHIERPQAS